MPRYHIEDNFNIDGLLHGSNIEIMNPIPNIEGNIFGEGPTSFGVDSWVSGSSDFTTAFKSGGRAYIERNLAAPGNLYYNFDASQFNGAPQTDDFPSEEAWSEALYEFTSNLFNDPTSQRLGPSSCFNLVSGIQLPEISYGQRGSFVMVGGYPGGAVQGFAHGDVIVEDINLVGGSVGLEGWFLRTNGLFVCLFQHMHGLYYGSDVSELVMRRGFSAISYYISESPFLPSSLEGFGLQYGGVIEDSGSNVGMFLGHHAWYARRQFVALFDNFNYSTMGTFVHDGVIEFVPVHTESSSIRPVSAWSDLEEDYPLGPGTGYAEVGSFMRPGYATRVLPWDFTTIDFSSIEVPATPGYSLRFDRVSETYASIELGFGGWSPGGAVSGLSIDKIEARGDFLGGGSGWKIGSIASGGSGGGLTMRNYYVFIVLSVLILGIK